jgi:signal transduction histidine kinase
MLNTEARLKALEDYAIMDTPAERELDEVVELASKICGKPISLISLLDGQRQWFKAKVGLEVSETPIGIAFCKYAIEGNDVFIVNDATKDERFAENPLVTGSPDIRFYAGTPLTTPEGQNIGTLCVIDNKPGDITPDQLDALRILGKQVIKNLELKKALRTQQEYVAKIEDQRRELEQLLQFKDKVFALIGHDLKGPIGSLAQVMSMFRTGILSTEEIVEVAQTMELQIRDTESVLNNVLTWAKTNTNGFQPNKVEASVSNLVQEAVSQVALEAANKGIQVEIDQEPNNHHYQLDEESVAIVLRNLLRNAVKFCRKGDYIKVGAVLSENHQLQFHVKDTGIGFDDTIASRLFKDEEHVSTFGTAKEKGTGIGLLICKNLIQRNGGDIWAESKPNEGANFFFTLPI